VNSRQATLVTRLISYFMHPSLMQESDLRHRARILVATLLLLSVMIGLMCAGLLVAPMPPGPKLAAAGFCIFIIAGAVMTLFALRRRGNFKLCSMLVVVADFAGLTGAILIWGGGVISPVTQLLAMPPMLAYFFGGTRWGAITTLAALTEIIVFLLLANVGVQFPVAPEMQWSRDNLLFPSIIGLIFLSAMAFIYDYTAETLKRERDQEHANVNQMARTDALTGLSNRLSFDAELHARVADCINAPRDKFFALCYLDLDGFKPINDQFGHDVGDEVLREIAERLRQMMRDNDRIGRHGGDEFMLILDAVRDAETLRTIATRLLQAVTVPIVTSVGELRVGGSFGFAVCPDQAGDVEALMQAADNAMYTAKRAGGGWHVHRTVAG